jgi:hypothetical protein
VEAKAYYGDDFFVLFFVMIWVFVIGCRLGPIVVIFGGFG